jgi:hypothetical protein
MSDGGIDSVNELEAWNRIGGLLIEHDRSRFMRILSIATAMVRSWIGYDDYPNADEARRIVMGYATGGDRPEA